MDLVDASNAPVPVTVDPVTGNTVSANEGNNVTGDTHMADRRAFDNTADNDAEDFITDNTPTSHDFNTLPPETKTRINRLLSSTSAFWGVASPATPFPLPYLPDPDCHNWGLALITALNRLADLSGPRNQRDAVYYVIKNMRERNQVPDHLDGRDITVAMTMAGDFVIRLEDIEYSIYRMRNRVDSYRPGQQGRGRGRGNYRGGRGGGRGRGGGARGRGGVAGFV